MIVTTSGTTPRGMCAYPSAIPLRRIGQEDDLEAAAVFLASEASRFATDRTLVVDGGVPALYPSRG